MLYLVLNKVVVLVASVVVLVASVVELVASVVALVELNKLNGLFKFSVTKRAKLRLDKV